MKLAALAFAALSLFAGSAMASKCDYLKPKPFCGYGEYALCICDSAYTYVDCDWVCVSK